MTHGGAEAGGPAEGRSARRLEPLDDLVSTVDDLVRGLDDSAFANGVESRPPVVAGRDLYRTAPVVHSRAFVAVVIVVLVVFELVVLAWLLSSR
jgi:hypothetical protein